MGSNRIDHSLKDLEVEGGISKEVKGDFEQSSGTDASVGVENKSMDEQFDAGDFEGAEDQKMNSLRQSSVLEISQSKELNVGSSPRSGLDHCITAPVGVHRNMLIESAELTFFRSMTEKKETPRRDLRLDRLSEREKMLSPDSFFGDDIIPVIQHSIPVQCLGFEKGGWHHELLLMSLPRNLTAGSTEATNHLFSLLLKTEQKLIVNLVKIQNDGTVEVDIAKNAPVASELLELHSVEGAPIDVDDTITESNKSVPRLKIAILVVGTRGDVQPFLAMARRLQEFGHHVRLATHANFRNFVRSAGVDFYHLGGDPRVLAGYMARNKGFIPSGPGEISIQRKQLKAIIESLLPACTESDLETGVPFRAQAIIGNPPAYGCAHIAEALGVPLHIFFTMPWTPTYEFPHPLARVPQTAGYWLSYIVVDLLIWWGVRGYINDFRKRKLKLPPIAYFSMYRGSISHLPTGYMWSPHVVPKPNDWGPLVDVVGYCFLNLGSKYQPREEFVEWIQKGPKPIYIGFGSMPLDDSKKTTDIILEALKDTGQRGIIDRGWGDLGILPEVPDSVFLLEDCPHDWLFPQCSAVVHHGGAGTTATGLRAGCPTTIVPFFGDQFFWGDRIHQRGLGPAPIPISQLSIESLSNAIRFMLQPEVKSQVIELAKLIENEDGVAAAVDAFHRHLPPELPLTTASIDEDEHPNPMQWFFLQIEKWCCLPCGP